MSIADFELPPVVRAALHRLADGLLPLDAWIARKADHVPDPAAPWRNGSKLSAENLRLGDFLVMIVRESSWNADLKATWDARAADPLGLCPLPDAGAWRRNRGLDPEPAFAITSSDVILGGVRTRDISRMEFYGPFWDPLVDAYARGDAAAVSAGVALDEAGFASDLLDGRNAFWEATYPSSEFCTQFVKDVLYCYLGLRNLAPRPFDDAVLVELGEGRRVGNRYTSADAAAAVAAFRARHAALAAGMAPPERTQAAAVHGIGSPAVNARDL